MNDGPLECASCGGPRPATVPWVCGECLIDAAEYASGMLADLSDAGVGKLLQDRWLLADVGMPVAPRAMTDAVELNDPREIAVHRAHLVWVLAEEVAWLRAEWDAAVGVLEDHGFLGGRELLAVGTARAVEAALDWRQMCERNQDAVEVERKRSAELAAVARRLVLVRHTEHDGGVDVCEECRSDWALVDSDELAHVR